MKTEKKVLHSDGYIESFKPRFIKEQLLKETDISEEEAERIKIRVTEKIKKMDIDEISTSTIRAEVSAQLTSRGLFEFEEESRKLGMSVKEFEKLIRNGCKDNANIQYSPELIAKYAYDSIAKEYALLDMPEECAKAHIDGLVHCLSGNNDLIIKINDNIRIMNIVEVIDLYEFQDCYVPSINPLTLKIEWKKIIDGACTGIKPVYELEFAKGYKIECTADHKFLKYNSREQKFNKKYDLRIKDLKENNNIRFGSLNYIPYNNDKNYFESAFFGFFLGDGSLNKNKIQFHLVKQDKIDYITWLLDCLNINYKIKEYSTATQIICENKYEFRDKFSMPIFKLNYTGVLEGLINSDGYVTTHGKLSANYLEFDSTNKFITDLFFIACLTLNIRPSYQIIKKEEKNWDNIYRCIAQNNHVYNLLYDIELREGHKQRISKNKSNINIGQTSGLTLKNITELGEQLVYNITVEDNHNFMAGTQGFILTQNCHDLEYFHTRPNCFNADLRFYAKNGLKVDGKGDMGSVAKPAKTLEVLLNHMLQAWMAGAVVFSGGQGYVNFNTLLAPFAKGRTYDDIKQAIQGFIFNCNMSLICRGGQVLFSSIGLDLSIPDVLKDEPAIGPNGVVIGTYKDYQNEADMIFQAVCEVSNEKDGQGAWHRFPNILFNIREGDIDEYEGNCKLLHETGANNPTIYYVNCTNLERSVMGALTSDTPVMTDNGFKYPQSLNIGDNVMTYTKNGKREWKPIKNIILKTSPEKVFKIVMDNNYQFKVTENHKLPTKNGIIKSEDLKVGMELYNYIDEPFIPHDDFASEFIGVFLADGYIRSSERIDGRSSKMIEFHVKHAWKKNKIIDLCEKNSYEYIVGYNKDGSYNVKIQEEWLRDSLNRCYDLNGIKHFPNWVWNDKNIVANIIKGLMFDGRRSSKYRWDWSCSDFPLVVDVMYALSYIGRTTTLYIDNRNGDTGNWRTNYRVSFGLNYKPKNKTKIKSIDIVSNEDFVYDLEIEDNHNYVCGLGGIHSENCRTALPMNFTGDYETDCCNTGNFMYSTINLPLIALDSNGDEQKFWNRLGDICEIIYKTLHYRRECVIDAIYNMHMSDFLLQEDKDTKKPLYDIDTTTMTIGFCGLNECLEVLSNQNIIENKTLGSRIIAFLNSYKDKFKERDGLRWSVIASPAESTAHRFAKINKDKYPDCPVQGVKNNYYLTNSSHIPVSNQENLVEHIKNAQMYHPETLGGNILHLWLGEVWSDPESLWQLNKKIIESGVTFWAYSKVFTYCKECGFTLNDNIDICPICKSKDLMTYDRVTGYYLPTKGFNNGKQQEFKDRYRHDLSL